MRKNEYPAALRAYQSVVELFGWLVILALGIAFVVMGNTLGRIIGSTLLVLFVANGVRLLKRRKA